MKSTDCRLPSLGHGKIGGVVAALCILGFGGFFAAQTRAEQMVTLDGHSVQGMTDEDIANYLDIHAKDIEGRKLHLAAEGVDTTLNLDDLGAKLDRQYIDDELHLIGRQGMPWERVADVAGTLMHGKDIPLAIAVDEEKLDKALSDLHDKHDKDPENAFAYVKEDNKTVAVEPEKTASSSIRQASRIPLPTAFIEGRPAISTCPSTVGSRPISRAMT